MQGEPSPPPAPPLYTNALAPSFHLDAVRLLHLLGLPCLLLRVGVGARRLALGLVVPRLGHVVPRGVPLRLIIGVGHAVLVFRRLRQGRETAEHEVRRGRAGGELATMPAPHSPPPLLQLTPLRAQAPKSRRSPECGRAWVCARGCWWVLAAFQPPPLPLPLPLSSSPILLLLGHLVHELLLLLGQPQDVLLVPQLLNLALSQRHALEQVLGILQLVLQLLWQYVRRQGGVRGKAVR